MCAIHVFNIHTTFYMTRYLISFFSSYSLILNLPKLDVKFVRSIPSGIAYPLYTHFYLLFCHPSIGTSIDSFSKVLFPSQLHFTVSNIEILFNSLYINSPVSHTYKKLENYLQFFNRPFNVV